MSKGHAKHQERHHGLSLFGKELVRRCAAHCELCNANGVKLSIYEVPPIPAEPDIDHCIMICETCSEQLERPKRRDPNHWRCLTSAMWSTTVPVKLVAVKMLQCLSQKEDWAAELLEQVYLEPEEQAWLDKIEL